MHRDNSVHVSNAKQDSSAYGLPATSEALPSEEDKRIKRVQVMG